MQPPIYVVRDLLQSFDLIGFVPKAVSAFRPSLVSRDTLRAWAAASFPTSERSKANQAGHMEFKNEITVSISLSVDTFSAKVALLISC